jgi:S-methylmethionine-dependent homocysteine/selenocysteine methylase
MNKHITIIDGGMGRELERMGAPFRRPEWSALALMEAPHYVSRAHSAYIDAGAEIIITNSYALVPFHIGQEQFDSEGKELIKLAAQIARKAADESDKDILVAGSIPPAFGSYRADLYIEEEADDIYHPLIEEQNDYVDLWIAETVSSTTEAQKISTLLKENKKPLWLSYTVLDRQGKDMLPQLRSGESIEEALKMAQNINAAAVLFNCSQPEEMTDVLSIVQNSNIEVPYGIYANSFEPIKRDQEANNDEAVLRADTTPENYLTHAQQWASQGATIIGGCCGIGPEHISALKALNSNETI